MTNMDKARTALAALTCEELNELVPHYKALLVNARHRQNYEAITALKPGDKVVLGSIRPKHMAGSKGVVMAVRQTRVVVKFPGTQWAEGVSVPASALTKITK